METPFEARRGIAKDWSTVHGMDEVFFGRNLELVGECGRRDLYAE
jgi:hypothetical protein